MPASSAGFPDVLEKGLIKVAVGRFDDFPAKRKLIFGDLKSKSNQEKTTVIEPFTDWSPFTGTVSYQDLYQGYDVTISFDRFVSGFQVTRDLIEDDQYGVFSQPNRLSAQMARAGARTMESDGWDWINLGFTTVKSGHTEGSAGTGQTLFNSAHTSSTGGSSQSNTGTTALSATNVESIRELMVAWTDDRGNKIDVLPDTIIVPTASSMLETAFEIVGSSHKVDSDYNNVNFHQGKYKIIDSLYVATDKYVIADSQAMKDNLLWCDRIPVEFGKDTNSNNLVFYFYGYVRYGWQWYDWRFAYGTDT